MKPCSSNRKLIAWLALDELDAEQLRKLRAHLDTCPGCRGYLNEVSRVKLNLAGLEIGPEPEVSPSFRRSWMTAIREAQRATVWEAAVAWFQQSCLNWRVALPLLGATALVVLALSLFLRRPETPQPVQPATHVAVRKDFPGDLPPTVSNYQMAANQSLEALDELLTRQGNRSLPPAPVYTASMTAVAHAAD